MSIGGDRFLAGVKACIGLGADAAAAGNRANVANCGYGAISGVIAPQATSDDCAGVASRNG